MVAELTVDAVEGLERRTLGHSLHDDFSARDHVCVKAVEGQPEGHHDVVSYVYDIVDGAQADGGQVILEPLGALLHFTPSHGDGGVARASLRVLDADWNLEVVIVNFEVIDGRTVQGCLLAVLYEPCVEVASYTVVRACIGAVGRYVHFNEPVALKAVVLGCWRANNSVGGEHDDSVVAGADAYLVLSTYHAVALYATQLRTLDDKLLVAIVEFGAERCHDDLLACSYVGGAAYYLSDVR